MHNGTDLIDGPIVISGRPTGWHDPAITVDERIGITKAADLPWRFSVTGSPFVSRRGSRVPHRRRVAGLRG